MYKIEDFRQINQIEHMLITQHSRRRFEERGIGIDDVCEAINTGEIIEQYEDDFPFPSCLIMGRTSKTVVHVVASINEEFIYVITAYIPNPMKWESDWKTRKEESK